MEMQRFYTLVLHKTGWIIHNETGWVIKNCVFQVSAEQKKDKRTVEDIQAELRAKKRQKVEWPIFLKLLTSPWIHTWRSKSQYGPTLPGNSKVIPGALNPWDVQVSRSKPRVTQSPSIQIIIFSKNNCSGLGRSSECLIRWYQKKVKHGRHQYLTN